MHCLSLAVCLLIATTAAADLPLSDTVRALASDPDRVGEALAEALRASEAAPDDPVAFAALVHAVQAARGPTLPLRDVRAGALHGGVAFLTGADGRVHAFDAATGAPSSASPPKGGARTEGLASVEATAEGCRISGLPQGGAVVLAPCERPVAVAASPDGTRAIVVTTPSRGLGVETLWDLVQRAPVATLRSDVNIAGAWVARFAPRTRRVFTYDNAGMRAQPLYDLDTGEVVAVLGPVQRDGRFTPDGRRVVLADVDLQSFDTDDGVLVSRLPLDGDAWSPRQFLADGRHIAVPRGGHTVLWDVVDGAVVEAVGAWDNAGSDGRRVLSGRPGGPVRVVDTGPAEARTVRQVDGWRPRAIAVGPDGSLAGADATRVRAWDAEGALRIDVATPSTWWLAFADDLLVGSTGEVWDLEFGQRIASQRFRALERVTPAPGGEVAHAWDRTGQAPSRFRDLLSGDTIARIEPADELRAGEHAFSRDNSAFAAATPKGFGVWDVRTGARRASVEGGPFAGVAISGDGALVAAWRSEDTALELYDAADGRRLGSVALGAPITAAAFAPDGARVAAGDRAGRVRLHGEDAHTTALAGHVGAVEGLSFSPDGARVLSAGGGVVTLWDADTGLALASWASAEPSLARFTPDGEGVVHVATSGAILVQPATAAGYRAVACAWLRCAP